MNRIEALIHAYEDDTRPANEREAALAAIRSLISNGSDEAERRAARAALNSLEGNLAEDAPIPLENELVFGCHAANLADVSHYYVHEFVTEHRGNPDADRLYQKWLRVSPTAQYKMKEMKKHLRNYLLTSYDILLGRYRAALDSGSDMGAVNREALEFYKSWTDSVILPEELRAPFREMAADLTIRCEGQHDHQNR